MKKTLSLLLASDSVAVSAAGWRGAPQTPLPKSHPPANSGSQGNTQHPRDAQGSIKVAALDSAYEDAYPGMWKEIGEAFTARDRIESRLIVDRDLEERDCARHAGRRLPRRDPPGYRRDKKLTGAVYQG